MATTLKASVSPPPETVSGHKIIDSIRSAESRNEPFWSFEFFPPKTSLGVLNLYDRLDRMRLLGPTFIDVTWGAGGSNSDLVVDICQQAQAVYGLNTCMHLTCTCMPVTVVKQALDKAKAAGIRNILALRGDPPRGQYKWTAVEDGFTHAIDLVKYIKKNYGDYFCISVAGFPEGHDEQPENPEQELIWLKEKIEAGADYIVTQLFYDCDKFLEYGKKCREAGINVPIIPGICPIQSYGAFQRILKLCPNVIPPKAILEKLEPIKDDDQAVKNYGIELAIEMCKYLQKNGILAFHFYTFNLEKSTRLILEGLQFVAPWEKVKPLPWAPALLKNREKETVRPIYWRNRTDSYIQRTESWDDFPNGRWGDSRSPAFGDIDGYGLPLKFNPSDCLSQWGTPQTETDVNNVFAGYVQGKVAFLPWSSIPLSLESSIIKDQLMWVNQNGFLTVNSQPSVDGESSSHKVFGWGPKHGFVYQRAYLEFFCSEEKFKKLKALLDKDEIIHYYGCKQEGDIETNHQSGEACAATWGIFPGREVVQPTIVDPDSFMAWKEEAFQLWSAWETIYEPDTPPRKLIQKIRQEYYLVNILDNDYKRSDEIYNILKNVLE
ncbi:hypothetical protein HK098_005452 [Nowakowskiella sp. JEL0407]|nr:hypothetical protein HK098_005452 [Nowakowskiella sp. JEL0407]